MSKNQDKKRKEQLARKALNESFRFQVWFGRNQKQPELPDDSPLVNQELDVICEKGLAKDMLTLRDIMEGVRKDLGAEHLAEKCSLRGSMVCYLLGITTEQPNDKEWAEYSLADPTKVTLPLQIQVYYDNSIRNQVVDWVKGHYAGVTTRLSSPILKLPSMVIEFQRFIPKGYK